MKSVSIIITVIISLFVLTLATPNAFAQQKSRSNSFSNVQNTKVSEQPIERIKVVAEKNNQRFDKINRGIDKVEQGLQKAVNTMEDALNVTQNVFNKINNVNETIKAIKNPAYQVDGTWYFANQNTTFHIQRTLVGIMVRQENVNSSMYYIMVTPNVYRHQNGKDTFVLKGNNEIVWRSNDERLLTFAGQKMDANYSTSPFQNASTPSYVDNGNASNTTNPQYHPHHTANPYGG